MTLEPARQLLIAGHVVGSARRDSISPPPPTPVLVMTSRPGLLLSGVPLRSSNQEQIRCTSPLRPGSK